MKPQISLLRKISSAKATCDRCPQGISGALSFQNFVCLSFCATLVVLCLQCISSLLRNLWDHFGGPAQVWRWRREPVHVPRNAWAPVFYRHLCPSVGFRRSYAVGANGPARWPPCSTGGTYKAVGPLRGSRLYVLLSLGADARAPKRVGA